MKNHTLCPLKLWDCTCSKTKTFKIRIHTNTCTFVTRLHQKRRRTIKKNIVKDVTHEVKPDFIKHWTDYLVLITIIVAFANIYIYVNINEETSC